MNVGIIGHFAENKNKFDGQTVKTRCIYEALKTDYNITTIDTDRWQLKKISIFFNCLKLIKSNSNVIILTAQRGLFVFIPLFVVLNLFFKKKLHYVVIGAWLEEKIKNKKFMIYCLKRFNYIYVENNELMNKLNALCIDNVYIMKNFKHITPVKRVNKVGKKVNYKTRFLNIQNSFPSNICYKGCINYNESVNVLKKYDILLFPTKFKTEGIPGTIIDAYASGLAIISSIWDNYDEIIDNEITGIGFKINNYDDFKKKLIELINDKNKIYFLKKNALKKFKLFSNDEIKVLKNNM